MGDNNVKIYDLKSNKGENISVNSGDFVKVNNFDPLDKIFETNFDTIIFDKNPANKSYYFIDEGTGKAYAFAMNSKDQIVSGAIIDYAENQTPGAGIKSDPDGKFYFGNIPVYEGNTLDKDKIKSFLKIKINGTDAIGLPNHGVENIVNTFNLNDDKTENITVKTNDYITVKNFDTKDNVLEVTFDRLLFDKKPDTKSYYFLDEGTGKAYAFTMNDKDQVIGGAIVEYSDGQTPGAGMYFNNSKSFFPEQLPVYNGNSLDKDKIKSFLKTTINGTDAIGLNSNIDKSTIAEAASIVSGQIAIGQEVKNITPGSSKGSNFIG